MKPIGGYFSLELSQGEPYHPDAIALNTGRNCLEYVLRVRGYKKIYIPYYTCDVVLEPFHKLNVGYEYYHIDQQLELCNQISLQDKEALLYTNYFGLKQRYVEQLAERYGKQLIMDNTQAFYAKPVDGIDTFYTCRKFFGVPDGAYLYTDAEVEIEMGQDVSYDRMSFLLKRIDLGPEAGYADFREQSARLVGQPIKRMSKLTRLMMNGIDYEAIAQRRRENYLYLQEFLSSSNRLRFPFDGDAVPMVYPYLTDEQGLKNKFVSEKVFVATYWPNVFEWCKPVDWEYQLTDNTVFFPIDQRYDSHDLQKIIEIMHF